MGDLLEKFEMLDTKGQQQLLDYLDFLLSQKKVSKKFDYQAYRKGILTISTWSDEDIAPIEAARQLLNQRKLAEW